MLSFKKHAARRRIERLLHDGVGLQETRWELAEDGSPRDTNDLIAPIIAWVREAMSEMRRPNGIDQVALALACRDEHGRVLCSNSFGVLRPGAFYDDDGVDRVTAFMADVEAVPREQRREIVGALLSLGDIAYEMAAAA